MIHYILIENTVILQFIIAIGVIVFLLFASHQKAYAWLLAIIISIGLSYLTYLKSLFLQSGYFLTLGILSIKGIFYWQIDKKDHHLKHDVYDYEIKGHFVIVFIAILASLIINNILNIWYKATYSAIESFLFCFSFVALYLLVRKNIMSWMYWVFTIFFMIIYLFITKQYVYLPICFIYIICFLYGYKTWFKIINNKGGN